MVPSGYWKILAIREGNTVKLAAFVLDQATPRGANFCTGLTTVDEIERRSGLNVFHGLSEADQAALAPLLGCEP